MGKKSVDDTTMESTQEEVKAALLIILCASAGGALGISLQKGAAKNPTEPQRAHMPLQHLNLKES